MKFYRAMMTFIINSIGAALVVPLSKELSVYLNMWISIISAAVISSIIIIFFKAIFLEIPYLVKPLRKKLLPIAEMEGSWVEIVNTLGERVVSVAHIDYDKKNKKHFYHGIGYDQNGNIKATWTAKHLSHESGDNIHAFTFTGNGTYKETNQRVRTVGQVSFNSLDPLLNPHELSTGYGAYYDYDVNNDNSKIVETKNTFDIYKLSQKDYIMYIGKKKPESKDDWKQFVINYYKANIDSSNNNTLLKR